jgi:hypothetical protein
MSARLLVNIGLLALLAALGWYTFKVDTPPPTVPGIALTSLPTDRVTTIQIDRDGNTVARLQREGERWRVEIPINAAADTFRVQTLLGLARARSKVGFRAAGNDLTQYGLQPPRATVHFDSTVLFVGDTDPVDGHRYVMSDEQVHLLEDNWFSQIFGDGTAWLDPRPLPAGTSPRRIELRGGPRPATRWQQIDGRWHLSPTSAAADAAAPTGAPSTEQRGNALAEAWQQARALTVQRRDPTLDWSGYVLITFAANQAATSNPAPTASRPDNPDLNTQQSAAHDNSDAASSETLTFSVALTDDALFLAREDLDVQYRFLVRQGKALLGVLTPP